MTGKGSKQRPTDHQKFSNNYDRIFAKKKKSAYHAPVDGNPVPQTNKPTKAKKEQRNDV